MIDPIDDGGPIAPTPEIYRHPGLSRRDWLAGLVMQALVNNDATKGRWLASEIAKDAYDYADAIIAAGKGAA